MSDDASSNAGPSMSLGSLIFRILGEIRAMATADGMPAPSAIVTARAVAPTGSGDPSGEGNTRHVIIFLGGSATGMYGSAALGDFASSEGDFQQILARLAQLHQPQGPPPATKAALDALPLVVVDEAALAESPRCPICCEGFCLDTEVCKLPCQHFFDRVCVMEWLTKHNTCPICRYELPVDDAESERDRKARMTARGIDEDSFFAAHAKPKASAKKRVAKRKRKEKDEGEGAGEAITTTTTTTTTSSSSGDAEPEDRPARKRRRTDENRKQKEKQEKEKEKAEEEERKKKERKRKQKKRARDAEEDDAPERKESKPCKQKSRSAKTEKKEAKGKKEKKGRGKSSVKERPIAEKETCEPKKRERRLAKRTKHEAV